MYCKINVYILLNCVEQSGAALEAIHDKIDSVLKFKYLSCFTIVECAVSGVIFISESRSKNIKLVEKKKNPPSFSSD